MGYIPSDYSDMNTFLSLLLSLQLNTASVVGYINYTKLHLFLIQILFIY